MVEDNFGGVVENLLDGESKYERSLEFLRRHENARRLTAILYTMSTKKNIEDRKTTIMQLAGVLGRSYQVVYNWLNELQALGIFTRDKGRILVYREGNFTPRIKKAMGAKINEE